MRNFTEKLFNFFSSFKKLKIIIIFTLFININCGNSMIIFFDKPNSNRSESINSILASHDKQNGDNDFFGQSVAISGNILAVAAEGDDDNGSSSGSVYLYDLANSNEETKIKASNGTLSDFFGTSVALSGNTLAVGVDSGFKNFVELFNY